MSSPKNKNSRGIFSISKEFEVIHDILADTSNASRFICEAIIEKHNKQNGHMKALTPLPSEDILAKISQSLDKCCNSLDGLIELKVKDVIQKIITTNQANSVLAGTFSGVRSTIQDSKEKENEKDKYVNTDTIKAEDDIESREEKLSRFNNW